MSLLPGVVIQFKAEADKARKDIAKLTKSIEGVGRSSQSSSGSMKKLATAAKVGFAAAAAGAAVGAVALLDFAKAATADWQEAEKLARSLKKSTGATKKQNEQISKWIDSMELATNISDTSLRKGLSRLARSTKDLGAAQKLSTLAMDIAAETGKDYETVANALAKANDGQIGALKKLGLTLGDTAENANIYQQAQRKLVSLQGDAARALEDHGAKSKEFAAAQEKVTQAQKDLNDIAAEGIDWEKELAKSVRGAAKAAAKNDPWATIGTIWGQTKEALGQFALPILQQFSDWFADKKNQEGIQSWITKVGEFSTEIGEKLVAYVKSTFIPFVENELIPAVEDVYAYFASPEGKAQIKAWGDAFIATADAVQALIGKLDTLFTLIDKLPSNFILQKLGLIPKLSDLTGGGSGAVVTRDQVRAGAIRAGARERAARNWQNEPRGVSVTVINGKQEPSLDSAALAIRLARRVPAS